MCGRQHDSDHWLAPSHDPVVMGGLSRRGDVPDKPGSSHKGNVDAGYPPGGRRMNDFFFIAFHLLPCTRRSRLSSLVE